MPITCRRTTLAESRWLTVYRDRLTSESGEVYEYYHVALPASVTVLAIDETGSVAVTIQRIHTHDNGRQWRLPAGGSTPAPIRRPTIATRRSW